LRCVNIRNLRELTLQTSDIYFDVCDVAVAGVLHSDETGQAIKMTEQVTPPAVGKLRLAEQ
jgi:hypothetical protein